MLENVSIGETVDLPEAAQTITRTFEIVDIREDDDGATITVMHTTGGDQ